MPSVRLLLETGLKCFGRSAVRVVDICPSHICLWRSFILVEQGFELLKVVVAPIGGTPQFRARTYLSREESWWFPWPTTVVNCTWFYWFGESTILTKPPCLFEHNTASNFVSSWGNLIWIDLIDTVTVTSKLAHYDRKWGVSMTSGSSDREIQPPTLNSSFNCRVDLSFPGALTPSPKQVRRDPTYCNLIDYHILILAARLIFFRARQPFLKNSKSLSLKNLILLFRRVNPVILIFESSLDRILSFT